MANEKEHTINSPKEFKMNTCVYCGKYLTEEETEYYHNTCENCEIEIHEKLINELRLEKSNKNYVNS